MGRWSGLVPLQLFWSESEIIKRKGHNLLWSKTKILGNSRPTCNSELGQSLGRSESPIIRTVLRRWNGWQSCCSMSLPQKEAKLQKGENQPLLNNCIYELKCVWFVCLFLPALSFRWLFFPPLSRVSVYVSWLSVAPHAWIFHHHQVSNSLVLWGDLLWNTPLLSI